MKGTNAAQRRGAVSDLVRTNLAAVLIAYGVILIIGLLLPFLAIVLYFAVALGLILPLERLEHLIVRRKR